MPGNSTKPANWRTYYGPRPSYSLHWKHAPGDDAARTREYLRWLCTKYGWASIDEARKHVAETQRHCGLISAVHDRAAVEPIKVVTPPQRLSPADHAIRAIGRITSRDTLHQILTALEDRWQALPEQWPEAAD